MNIMNATSSAFIQSLGLITAMKNAVWTRMLHPLSSCHAHAITGQLHGDRMGIAR